MTWTELENTIEDTIEKIKSANPYSWLSHIPMVTKGGEIVYGDLKGNPDDLEIAKKNVKALCDYMFADGKIDIDKDICLIYDCAKKLSIDARTYINSNSDIKRILYEDNKAELDNEPISIKELSKDLSGIEGKADNITRIIDMYFARKGEPHPEQATKEPHPEPQNCENGESKGSGTETPSEALEMEKLPTISDDEETRKKEQQVFYNAINAKWMKLNNEGSCYIWDKGKGYNHLGYMCGRLYCGDEVRDKSSDSYEKIIKKGGGRLHKAAKLKTLFNGVDVANTRSQLFKEGKKPPKNWRSIDLLFD